ncbi:ATP-dependent DNA helicase RecG [Desulfosporosinus fructosivorans]|uniref:ATP-dependent DNA helicase RecG n=1 Tax=Desulfosporosinus fructosivorans TaxID=2018669 RepID=A0A4Z0RBG1_9FIRM|nr:ATP-dependent DNA helicase RecG [Desulfosporosinus fructosivorans]TGE40140.1 ATP-dependent DNA helicase RecG [Desulfosporosinus fructosivorans]
MKSTQVQLVLNNLQRALLAEEKQGFTNTGVLGGFNVFMRGILPRLEQIFPGYDMDLLRSLAMQYPSWSPLRRREAFSELRRFMQEISLEAQGRLVQSEPSNVDLKLQGKQDLEEIRDVPGKHISDKQEDQKPLEKQEVEKNNDKAHSVGLIKSQEIPLERAMKGSNLVSLQSKPLQYLKGVGPERAKQLERLGIHNILNLLQYFPRRYEDRRKQLIAELQEGEMATIAGKVVAGNITSGKMKVVKLSIEQQGRLFQATWFNQIHILKQFPAGTEVVVTGKVRWKQQVPEVMATDIEKVNVSVPVNGPDLGSQTILPVYSETARLSSKVIRNIIQGVLEQVDTGFREILPHEDQLEWMERSLAYREIHFPENYTSLAHARERLVWEEILFLQLAVAGLHKGMERLDSPPLLGGEEKIQSFYEALPFKLTKAQQRVIQEIFQDLARPQGMARLVQGDVGSGKTAVAMAALLRAVGSGYQGAMMAPTEILAVQHYQSLEKIFTSIGISVVCLLGSQSKSVREETLAKIANGEAQVVVGTHALIQETVIFKALGLAVTDEQHRFGVRQRSLLQSKGESPHVLVLTATPIPRTLALTLYGDLQLSVLDEMPVGRKAIITRKLAERARPKMEKFLDEQINSGRQIYVVCPLVEESETLDLISATQRATDLQDRFPNRRVALLHGRMKGIEKETIMTAFHAGEIDILVATTVVEVGVNVPNATVMVIESAERFGLAQLHQLRGRVGRGKEQSYCFLLSGNKDSRRLDILCQTEDGFKIAEEDMRLRGTGELLGTRQHGLAELRLADLSQDGHLVEKAYQMAQKALQDPEKYELLFQEVRRTFPLEEIGVH